MRLARVVETEWFLYALTGILSLVLLVPVMRIDRADLRVPFVTVGDAEFYQGIIIRPLLDRPWYLENPDLGAPDGLSLHDYPTGTDSGLYALMKAIAVVARDSAVTLNLFFILTFPLIALAMLHAARALRLRGPTAVAVALLFAFLPYHLMRGEGHVALSAYFMLPMGLTVALQLGWAKPRETTAGGGPVTSLLERFSSRSFLLGCVVSILTAVTGVYYALFYIVTLFVAGARRAFDRRRWVELLLPTVFSAVVIATVLLSNVPTFLYQAEHGRNETAAGHNTPQAEVYALRLVQLFVPITGHRIPRFFAAEREYKQFLGSLNPAFDNESRFASLGVLAALGFVALVAYAVLGLRPPPEAAENDHLGDLSAINLAMLLLGIVGGFGYLIAVFITPMFRGYNRVSIVIGMVSLLAVGVLVDRVLSRFERMPVWVPVVVSAVLLGVGIFDQTSPWYVPDYATNKAANEVQRSFASAADKALPAGSMVFQLPYVTFPGADRGYPAGFSDYTLLIPYMYSRNLRWSAAAMRSRPTADWQSSVSSLAGPALAAALKGRGFRGVYVDALGYEDGGAAIAAELTGVLGSPIVSSPDGRFRLWGLSQADRASAPSAAVSTVPPAPAPANAIGSGLQNGSFEQWVASGPAGWSFATTAADGSASPASDWKTGGKQGVRLADSAGDPSKTTDLAQRVRVEPGEDCVANVWAASDRKPSLVRVGLRFLDAKGTLISETWTAGDKWGLATRGRMERMTVSGAAPGAAASVEVVLRMVGGERSDRTKGPSSAVFDEMTLTTK